MVFLKAALQHGRTMLTDRITVSRLGSRSGHLVMNEVNASWRRNFSSKLLLRTGGKRSANVVKHVVIKKGEKSNSMKWVVITGFTLVLGGIMLVSRSQTLTDDENHQVDGERKTKRDKIRIFDNNWLYFCYSTLPLNAISRLWGKVNSIDLPIWIRPWGFRFYSYLFAVNLEEMEDPDLTHYANLSEFFDRSIKEEVRPIAKGEDLVVSPSDGRVLQIGRIDSETGEIEQVKGITYSIKEFLGTHASESTSRSSSSLDLTSDIEKHKVFADKYNFIVQDNESLEDEAHSFEVIEEGDKVLDEYKPNISKTVRLLSELSIDYSMKGAKSAKPTVNDLYFAVIYLAPGDYHHYHSPVDWVCKLRRHFPGQLYSVSPYFFKNLPKLFVLNERVSLLGHWKHGFFSMTPVGATNVGSIILNFDKELITNTKREKGLGSHTCYEASYEKASKILGGMPLIKGEDMGGFRLGSTVVLCFEAPSEFEFQVKLGEKVKMGQVLGSC